MSGTTVFYNGVRMVNVNTRQCEQDIILDPSGTDLLGQRLVMTFDTTVHTQHLESLFHGVDAYYMGGAANPQDLFTKVRYLLSQPRCTLLVDQGPVRLFEVYPASVATVGNSANYDVANGPHPKRVVVRQLVGTQLIHIAFTVEFMTGQCSNFAAPNVVLSNKWSIAEERDGNFFTTRRISGSIRMAHAMYAAHAFVPWVIPGLEYGFKREMVAYDANANNIEATYQVIDRQTHTAAPWPATTVSGTYSWSTTLETGNWVHHSEFQLSGPPDADVRLLVARAVELCDARVKYLSTNNPLNGPMPKLMNECSITEHVGQENYVRAQMTVTMYPQTPTLLIGNIVNEQIGAKIELQPAGTGAQQIQYDPGISRVPSTWGYVPRKTGERNPATLFLLHCYQQEPCSPVKGMYQWKLGTGKPQSGDQTPNYPTDLTPVQPGSLPYGDMDQFNSQEELQGVYTHIRASSTYRTHNRRAQLSLAGTWAADDGQPSCVIVKTGRPLTRRIVRYSAERQDEPPKLPQISDRLTIGGIGHTLLDYGIEVCAPKTAADGVHLVYRVEAWYLFALDRPLKTSDVLAMGRVPVLNAQKTLNLADKGDATLFGA